MLWSLPGYIPRFFSIFPFYKSQSESCRLSLFRSYPLPVFYDFSAFLFTQFKFCSWKARLTGGIDLLMTSFHTDASFHFDFLDFSSIFYRKFHIFRNEVSIRGLLFTKGIFCLPGVFDHIRVLSVDVQLSTFFPSLFRMISFAPRYLTGIRNVFLADFPLWSHHQASGVSCTSFVFSTVNSNTSPQSHNHLPALFLSSCISFPTIRPFLMICASSLDTHSSTVFPSSSVTFKDAPGSSFCPSGLLWKVLP